MSRAGEGVIRAGFSEEVTFTKKQTEGGQSSIGGRERGTERERG